MHSLKGGCHCGNISLALELSKAPNAYNPRACDCDFCSKHGASYISDPDGSIRIHINSVEHSRTYRQGSGNAEFLLCGVCGVLVSVLYREADRVYAAVNSKAVETLGPGFGSEQPVSPKVLPAAGKIARWQAVWFPDVTVIHGGM